MPDLSRNSKNSSVQTIMLVHGAWHDARCWSQLAPLLRKAGLHVLTPDLPGHGDNPLALKKVSLRRYSDYLCELIEQQNAPVALLGHSMSGMVITDVACRLPDKISKLIYLCAYLPKSGESLFDLISYNHQRHGPCEIEQVMQLSDDKRSCIIPPSQIGPLFYQKLDEDQQQQLLSQFNAQASLPLSTAVSFDQQVFDRIPKSYISCSADKVIPPQHQRTMISRQTCQALFQLDADHSPFYSVPEALASLLASYLNSDH